LPEVLFNTQLSALHIDHFYRWRVVGEQGREFTGYKFRTMVVDADARKNELMTRNELKGPVFKMKSDPRVTPVGRFLRKYSLDECQWSRLFARGLFTIICHPGRLLVGHSCAGWGVLDVVTSLPGR